MTATINARETTRDMASYRKVNRFCAQYSLISSLSEEVVCLRLYATDATVYAVVWMHGNGSIGCAATRGMGKAGGYGYHKASAAAEDALNDAGVTLSEPISGRGDTAIEKALLAVGAALGLKGCFIVRAHA